MKCPLCARERLLFWCLVGEVSHLICCVECAVRFGYRIIEEVMYGRKVRGTSKGRESVQDMRECKEPDGSSSSSSGKRGQE